MPSATPQRRLARNRANRRAAGTPPAATVTALLLVDVINPLNFEGAQTLAAQVPVLARRLAWFKQTLCAQGVPAIYANDRPPGMPWRSDFSAMVLHCIQNGGPSAQLATALAPQPADHTMFKPRHSAFHDTALPLLLTQMGVRRLVICGLATDLCVQFTAMDAFARGFELWVPGNCSAAEQRTHHKAALAWMARRLQAHVEPATAHLLTRRALRDSAGNPPQADAPLHGK